MRQRLGIGRIWTEGYYDSLLFDPAAPNILIPNYVAYDNVLFYDYEYNTNINNNLLRQVNKSNDGNVHTIVAADLLNDGNTEVIIPDYSASMVYVYGLVNGVYSLVTQFSTNSGVVSMIVGDVLGDGRSRLLLENGAVIMVFKCMNGMEQTLP